MGYLQHIKREYGSPFQIKYGNSGSFEFRGGSAITKTTTYFMETREGGRAISTEREIATMAGQYSRPSSVLGLIHYNISDTGMGAVLECETLDSPVLVYLDRPSLCRL